MMGAPCPLADDSLLIRLQLWCTAGLYTGCMTSTSPTASLQKGHEQGDNEERQGPWRQWPRGEMVALALSTAWCAPGLRGVLISFAFEPWRRTSLKSSSSEEEWPSPSPSGRLTVRRPSTVVKVQSSVTDQQKQKQRSEASAERADEASCFRKYSDGEPPHRTLVQQWRPSRWFSCTLLVLLKRPSRICNSRGPACRTQKRRHACRQEKSKQKRK